MPSGREDPFPHARPGGDHFSCSMTAVLVARVRHDGGDDAVADLLTRLSVAAR